MTWLAIVTISLAAAIFLVGQKSKGRPKPTRIREGDIARSYESRYRSTPGKGDDMKKWRDADYSR
jgi:hypothetical protein